ncbi:CsbD family protein [Rariglobus hedericola]|uniref:CsbD family protein n=1 Tax=Rariglobus hedericola TaxID=2597822 RepID=A0A556QKQ2_9BACT|nr:CsbD family protein [Rariglobus hedericola]TSJ77197.1 CsbD family protein [Rariglobus hedericola]
MKSSTRDRIEGGALQASGKVKEAAGKLTKNTRLQGEGVADQAVGKVQRKVGSLKKAVGR